MGLYVYNGSSWSSQASGFKLYNGSSWTNITRGYVYNGSSWSQFYPEAPAAISNPTISTSSGWEAQSTLTAGNGTWTNSPTSYTYQWQRGNTATGSWTTVGTSSTYSLTTSDVGYHLRLGVTATNARGSTTAYSSDYLGAFVQPQKISGLSGSKTGSGSVFFSWNSSVGAGANGAAANYNIQYGYGSFTSTTTNSTSFSLSGITSPNFYFYVAARAKSPITNIEFEGSGSSLTLMNVYP